jgi:hypothetical protein
MVLGLGFAMLDYERSDAHHSLMMDGILREAIEDGARECFHLTKFGKQMFIENVQS